MNPSTYRVENRNGPWDLPVGDVSVINLEDLVKIIIFKNR